MEKWKKAADKTIFNRLLFKVIFLITVMITIIPYLHEKTGAYVKLLLAWGLLFVCKDLITTKGKCYCNRYILTLLAFLGCYGVTILAKASEHRGDSIKSWMYMFITFTVLFVSDAKTKESLEKEIKVIMTTIISCTAILSAVCIFTYIFQINTSYEAEGIKVYVGMYDNRLWGLFNPNVGAMLSMVSLMLSYFLFQKTGKKAGRGCLIGNMVLQFMMIILTGSRTVIYGTALGIAIFVAAFFRKKPVWIRMVSAVAAPVAFIGLTIVGAPVLEKIPRMLDSVRIEVPRTTTTAGETNVDETTTGATMDTTAEEVTTSVASGDDTASDVTTGETEAEKSAQAGESENTAVEAEKSAQAAENETTAVVEKSAQEAGAQTAEESAQAAQTQSTMSKEEKKAAKKESIRESKKEAKKESIRESKKAAKKESIRASKKAEKREEARKEKSSLDRSDTGQDSKGGILNGRQYIWQAGLEVFSTSPLLGVTKENIYEMGVNEIAEPTFQRAFQRGGLHNVYLTVLVASGILGCIPFVIFLLLAAWGIFRYLIKMKDVKGNFLYLGSVFVVFLYLMMEMFEARILYEVNVNFIMFWILLGLSLTWTMMDKKKVRIVEGEKKTEIKESHKRFFANTGWLVMDKVFTMVLSLVIMSITSRYLGKTNYGILNYGLSFVNIFVAVCKLGIDSILVAELVKKPEKANEYIGTTIVLRIASGVLGIIITALFVLVLKPGDWVIFMVSVIQAVSLIFTAFDTIDFYFQSQLKSKYSAISKSSAYVLVCVVRIIFVILRLDVTWFAIATVVDALAIGIFLVYFYRKMGGGFSFQKSTAGYLLRVASPFILANLLVIIYTQMDKIMVGSISTQAQVGIYTAAMNIANMWVFIPNALMDSARPIIMNYSNNHDSRYHKRYVQLISAVIWISIAAGIFFTIFPKLCIGILYGKGFMEASTVLVILIWSRLFSLIGTVRTIWLICEKKEKYVKWFVGGGAVCNVILNCLWIGNWGAKGAAMATLITEILVAIVLPMFSKETRGFQKLLVEAMNPVKMLHAKY